jgi:hypothetical protein
MEAVLVDHLGLALPHIVAGRIEVVWSGLVG